MNQDIESIVEQFETGRLSRRELIAVLTQVSVLAVGATAAVTPQSAVAEEPGTSHSLGTPPVARSGTEDYAKTLVERIANTTYTIGITGKPIVETGWDVFGTAGPYPSKRHEAWLFGTAEGVPPHAFPLLRMKSGRFNQDDGKAISEKYPDPDGIKPDHPGAEPAGSERTWIYHTMNNLEGLGVFGDGTSSSIAEQSRLLYEVLRQKIQAEERAHCYEYLRAFAAESDKRNGAAGANGGSAAAFCEEFIAGTKEGKVGINVNHEWY